MGEVQHIFFLSFLLFVKCLGLIDSGAGSDPEWNETFVFTLTDHVSELTIKLMDSDSVSNDDYVGEAK